MANFFLRRLKGRGLGRDELRVAAACTALGGLTTGVSVGQAWARGKPLAWGDVLGPELLFWYAWGGAALGIFWLARRWPVGGPGRRRAWGAHALASLAVPLLAYGGYLLAYAGLRTAQGWWLGQPAWPALLPDLSGQLAGYYLVGPGVLLGTVTYWGLVAVASARAYYGRLQTVELRRSRLETQLAQAQLQTLKAQLHPHFLFNTFNSISALLQTDPAAADQMLARLGDFLRLTLANSQVEFVSLAEEVAFAQRYLDIEAIRFADRLRVVLAVEPAARDARVPALLLQPLVENAVKHGIARRIGPGCIALDATLRDGRLRLRLVNDGGPPPEAGFGAPMGHGLGATGARLRQLYGPEQQLRTEQLPNQQFAVTIHLPYQAVAAPLLHAD
ncbi:histidine kinase [Hymenobacter sp.]|uniref:sensor histidine kinase n=1 Tax=Hymenobacter sp. TaxID=1898978 RepID=UPI00286A1004|nr:histidine kinase [Hymenobacter sp.]